jgi:hypothetical protein
MLRGGAGLFSLKIDRLSSFENLCQGFSGFTGADDAL